MTDGDKIAEYQAWRERVLQKWHKGDIEKETAQVCIGEINRWIEEAAK